MWLVLPVHWTTLQCPAHLVAGLGVGGLAVALAVRPTLENLIGGVILFTDRPVSVGDFCSFDTHTGIIEKIGLRSTQLRALDRTIVTIPNATLADTQIVNWSRCDRMLIKSMIGLRYETKPDQLRYVLAKLREMFLAHPKIDHETVRVRFVGHGDYSLDIEIRVLALTQEWNEFYAIREDVLLRATDIVNSAGTGFAFPSQTLYMGTDDGLDEEKSAGVMEEVQTWRHSGSLPFPYMASSRRDQLSGTLDYPPDGSPDARQTEQQQSEQTEPLSSEPGDEEQQ